MHIPASHIKLYFYGLAAQSPVGIT